MKTELVQSSIVVVGDGFSSMSARPDVLQRLEVIPPNWIVAENTVITPIVTLLIFTNGVELLQEPNLLQLRGPLPELLPSVLAKTAAAYLLNANPLVPCTAVGVNFDAFISEISPARFLSDNLANPGAWPLTAKNTEITGVRYKLDREGAELRLSLETAARFGVTGIGLTANYHAELQDIASSVQIAEALERIDKHFEDVSSLLDALSLMGTAET